MNRLSDKSQYIIALVFVVLLIAIFDLLSAMPQARASLYPVLATFSDAEAVDIKNQSLLFSKSDNPTFVFSSNCGHFYEFKLYPKDVFLDDVNSIFDGVKPSESMLSEQLNKNLSGEIFAKSGFLIPRNEKVAEIRVVVAKKLAVGDYALVFRTRSAFGKYEGNRLVFFAVTDSGAASKDESSEVVTYTKYPLFDRGGFNLFSRFF